MCRPPTLDSSSARYLLVEEAVEMLSRRFLDSGTWVVGGGLLVVLAAAMLALAPTAIERWF